MAKIQQITDKDIKHNAKMYDEYVNDLHWQNGWDENSQEENFADMLKIAKLANSSLANKTCLDVGCGTGDLSKRLRNWNIKSYTGIDIYHPFLEQAKQMYPQETFIEGDILQNILTKPFDFVFCSGALTVKLSINNYDFLEAMVEKMWSLTKIGMVFNVLTDDDPYPDPDLFFYNIQHVTDICNRLVPKAKLVIEKTKRFPQAHFYLCRS